MDAVSKLTPGVSTIDDAVRVLGPFTSESVYNGVHGYGWVFAQATSNFGTMNLNSQSVSLTFDSSGKLLQKSTSQSATR